MLYPVKSSKATAGSAIPIGWKIVEEQGNLYYVRVSLDRSRPTFGEPFTSKYE